MSTQTAFPFAPSFADRVLSSPVARRSDPAPSHVAGKQVTESGRREGQAMGVLALVKKYPCSTARELASKSDFTVHIIGRRLPELEKAGYIVRRNVRECSLGKRPATTWEAL